MPTLRPGDRFLTWALAAGAFATRVPFFGRYPTEWDSVQLVMGLDRFDVRIDSPHAPGYWLYVALGRLVRALTPLDAEGAMVVLAAAASAATVAVVYVIGRDVAGRLVGLSAAAFLITDPYMWFYGSIINNYAFDALACALLLYLALRARPGSRHGVAAAVVLALATGFRQSAVLLLGPLALAAVVRSVRDRRAAAATVLAGAAALGAWMLPLAVEQPGGLKAVQKQSRELWHGSVGQTSIFSDGPRERVHHNMVETSAQTLAATVYLLPVAAGGGVLALGAAVARRRRQPGTPPPPGEAPAPAGAPALAGPLLWLSVMAIVPSMVFMYLFHFGKSGYILTFLPAAALLALWPVAHLVRDRPLSLPAGVTVAALVAVGVLLGGQRFLYGDGVIPKRLVNRSLEITQGRYGAPYYLTAQAIRTSDAKVDRYRELEGVLDPARDVIVFEWLNGSGFLRHVMWTMRNFWVAMVVGNQHDLTGRNLVWGKEFDHRLEVPPGGRAVFVFDQLPPEVDALAREGRVQPLPVDNGLSAWIAPPGVTLFGVTVTEVPVSEMGPVPLTGRETAVE